MICSQCKSELKDKCPKCKKKLGNLKNPYMCGIEIIPENHCWNCWRKK